MTRFSHQFSYKFSQICGHSPDVVFVPGADDAEVTADPPAAAAAPIRWGVIWLPMPGVFAVV